MYDQSRKRDYRSVRLLETSAGWLRRQRSRGLRVVIVVLLLMLAAFGGGFWTGRATSPLTVADGDKFSISKNGVIHNESCRYFGKNQARNCAFCGGLSGK